VVNAWWMARQAEPKGVQKEAARDSAPGMILGGLLSCTSPSILDPNDFDGDPPSMIKAGQLPAWLKQGVIILDTPRRSLGWVHGDDTGSGSDLTVDPRVRLPLNVPSHTGEFWACGS